MELHIRLDGREDLAGQVYRQIRDAVLLGRLRAGEALPPTRELARRLEMSRTTVAVAYDRLAAEGLVSGRVGAGTFVSPGLARPETPLGPAVEAVQPRAVWASVRGPSEDLALPYEFDFRAGLPDARLFPYATWRRLLSQHVRASAVGTGMYASPAGNPHLRQAIARHVALTRAVRTDADTVLVTNGIQQAVDLVTRVVLEPGGRVAVEEPGYIPPRMAFIAAGARVTGVPVDAEGIVVEALPDDARIVYVTASHQFPLGMPMSLPRRLALLDWADRHGAVVIEDDYDSEFRFAGRPIEPLQNLDRSGRVIYVGSFSKVLLPTLRLGFLVAPASLHGALAKARFVADWHSAEPAQAALAAFIDEGSLARHVRKVHAQYRVRHQRIGAAMAQDLAPWLQPIPSVAGLHVSGYARRGSPAQWREVVARAREVGVGVYTLNQLSPGRLTRPGLVLGYGAIPTAHIDEGLRRLRTCLQDL